ncbi:MAG: starch synthase [Limisphaerales bacterium]|jgi:starch synthase
MDQKRVLILTQEMKPYLIASEMAEIANRLPQYIQENGYEIRVLMPRFGNINERRHRLHEVVRLSGMNIIVDEDDYPLIIKVASLPGARMQVYFLDNEDFFKRKSVFRDKDEKFHKDNAERMIFFCKGALETVKRMDWPPDIIHCNGWMTSLVPLYLKTAYQNEAVFKKSKIIYSVYKNSFEETFNKQFLKKAPISDAISEEQLDVFKGLNNSSLNQGGVHFSDGVIVGSEDLDVEATEMIQNSGKPVLDFTNGEDYLNAYHEFYESLSEKS